MGGWWIRYCFKGFSVVLNLFWSFGEKGGLVGKNIRYCCRGSEGWLVLVWKLDIYMF